jgi:hypothetical protein
LSFETQDGKTILVGARSGKFLEGSQEIRANREVKGRLLGASRGGIFDTISDVIDTITDAEYYICIDACIAGCHSLPTDITVQICAGQLHITMPGGLQRRLSDPLSHFFLLPRV